MLHAFAAAVLLAVAPSPSPSPSASPSASASPAPASSTAPSLTRIGSTATNGRASNLVGTAGAASEGTIDAEQIATRPILRPGEVLEAIPGLVISQHSGEGKANQYYLRGFQLDHGTDLDGTIAGVPVNLPTHAHGQGYSDINWLMPELVNFVEYRKGSYYADKGDFSTAGSYDVSYRNTIDPTLTIGEGDYGYDRLFAAGTRRAGAGNLLGAVELYHDNGTLDRPDEYGKINAVLRWSRQTAASNFNVTAWGYHGSFDSTDQIPQRLVDAGVLDRDGYVDPSDGGNTYRYALSTEYLHKDKRGTTRVSAYGFAYKLQLFSNFTYDLDDATDFYNVTGNPVTCAAVYSTCAHALTGYTGPRVGTATTTGTYTSYCPANTPATGGATAAGSVAVTAAEFSFSCGDQREQYDQRFVSGFDASRSFGDDTRLQTTAGIGLRNDNISTVGLYLTEDRNPLPNGTLSDDAALERDASLYVQSQWRATSKLRIEGGLRGDLYAFTVRAPDPADSGSRNEGLISPKLTIAYAFDRHNEAYLDAGSSFHSNDARGIFQTTDPQTHAAFDAGGTAVANVVPLVRARGYETGYRYAGGRLNSTISFWRLDLDSELVFNGDDGTTSPAGPTRRKGIEFTNFYTLTPHVVLDADISQSTAHFLTDPDGAGIFVPESLNVVSSAGVTFDYPHYSSSLRYRYFGPRTLDQLGDAVSAPSDLLNFQFTAKLAHRHQLTLEVLNVLNAPSDDVEYYYNSWTPQDAQNAAYAANPAINPALGGAGVADYHFHPAESRIVRLSFSLPL